MANMEQRVRAINDERLRVWEHAKQILDYASTRRRGLTGIEQADYEKDNRELDRLDRERDQLLGSEGARAEIDMVNEAVRSAFAPNDWQRRASTENESVRDFFRPADRRGDNAPNAIELDLGVARDWVEGIRNGARTADEIRTYQSDTGSTGGSLTVPTTIANSIYGFLVASSSVRRVAKIITTPSGNPLSFPKVTTHSVGTQIASQTTAVTTGTAVLSNMTLSAYDFGQLSAVSNDMLEDSGVDVAGFIAEQIGRSLGIVTGTAYAVGAGSTTPTGVITAAPTGSGGTVATGGTTLAGVNAISGLVDPFIDLSYSVVDGYRNSPSAAFLVNQLTAGVLRKARTDAGGTTGPYAWSPSPSVGMIQGQPDRFLGFPIYSDTNIASIASNAKICVFGAWDAFYVRDVGGVRLERSNDLYFNLNQTAYRGVIRTDSNCVDGRALNVLKMST
jgi:HK97 family phage major capsid protein